MSKEGYHTARYQRQMLLPELGPEGQQRLQQASVLTIGAGGLGCPALQYLTAAGVGRIGIVDHDTIDLSNLHRQILYKTADVGMPKATQAAEALRGLNPDVIFETYAEQLTTANALDILRGYDIILDGTDNFTTRYLINDACVLLGKPLVHGSISRFEGQVCIFNVRAGNEAPVNYRHLFPEPPAPGEVLSCAEAGVLGVLPGIIGTMQATEAIKLITGIGTPLAGRLFTYNALSNEAFTFTLQADDHVTVPADKAAFLAMDYDWFCGIRPVSPEIVEINASQFAEWVQLPHYTVIDVRETGEQPIASGFSYRQIPLSAFTDHLAHIEGQNVILFCQSGKRSLRAAQLLQDASTGMARRIYSLKGGIISTLTH